MQPDLIHCVPQLLEHLPSASLATLLASSKAFRAQVHGYVSAIRMDSRDIQVLTKTKWLKLRHIDLSGSRNLDAEAIIRLSNGVQLQLQSLNLSHVGPYADIISDLFTSPLSQLVTLKLSKNHLHAAALSHLHTASLPLLEDLDLSQNSLENEAIGKLSRAHCPRLKVLNLAYNAIAEDGLRHLADAQWPLLESLTSA